jgi:hypothetical protein
MNARRIPGLVFAAVFLLILLPAVSLSQDKKVPPVSAKIEAELLDLLSVKGNADFVVRMSEQADLSAAYQMRDWQARGQYVYNTLKQVAERSQVQVKDMLSKQGFKFQTFIAGNELYVWAGDVETAEALALVPNVASIRATSTFYLDPIIGQDRTPQSNPQAITDWGITDSHADQFWSAFGRQGEGIIVANIDTGVQWDHPALVSQFKCPGNPSNPACWADPSGICGGSACDNMGHGTHTMGTMVADDNPSLPYIAGMAPNAQWIACKGCEGDSCSDYALSACADWILAPGGDPANRPHLVNSSWGGGGCDTWYLPKVQAWRAAGIFPAFSAGNNYSCNSLSSPGDYPESFGSASHRFDRIISDFSSKGPSCFGDDPYTKPNISAPGENICSTVPGGWDCYYSGTSMASPHSAGAVALLWSCNPALVGQIDQTFEILQDSADAPPPGECGAPEDGEGNFTSGYGYLNIYQAGLTWCGDTGTLEGHVTDADTSAPIEEALIETKRQGGGVLTTYTGTDGHYTVTATVGTYDITASHYGHLPQTITGVEVLTDTVTTQDFSLEPAPTYTVDGTVTDANTGWPLYARIEVDGYPYGPVWTNPETGYYSVALVAGVEYTFHASAWAPGYLTESRTVGPLMRTRTENFGLLADLGACTAPGYQAQTLYSQDLEVSDGGFTTYGHGWNPTSWQWGTPTSGPGYAHSGANVWATNLSGSYSDDEDSYVESPDIDMSPWAGQGFALSWWQWLQTEGCCDFGEVQVSNDGGGSWSTVYGPAYGNVDLGWAQHSVTLASSYAVGNFRIRFHLRTDISVTYPGYYVDDIAISGDCQPQPGGLVVGNVYDANTTAPLVGAQVSNGSGGSTTTVATPDDPALDEAFYTLFSPAGDQEFTATMARGYGPDARLVPVVAGEAVRQDFSLAAGRLSFTPPGVEVTLGMGQSTTVPSLLSNAGAAPAAFEIFEQDHGFVPTVLGPVPGHGELLYHSESGVSLRNNQGTETVAHPMAYRWQPDRPTAAWNVLVYADDFVHTAPNTLVDQALQTLGIAYTAHYDADFAGFAADVRDGGPWDLIIFENNYYNSYGASFPEMLAYVQGGGRLAAEIWTMLWDYADPLYAELGVVYVNNDNFAPPVYWWEADHLLFNSPTSAPSWLNRSCPASWSCGQYLDPVAGISSPLAGYTLSAQAGQATLILRDDAQTLFKGFGDISSNADDDSDGVLDGVELWENIITGLLEGFAADVPWLSESPTTGTVLVNTDQPIDITFDASVPEITQPGEYHATLQVTNDTPYGPVQVPVTMTVLAPATWGKLEGTVTGLGYCDTDPAPLEEAEVLVEGSTGLTWTVETNAEGYYQLWLDRANSPVTVIVTYPEHETGQATGVVIVGQVTTTEDFKLRWLEPCVSVAPDGLSTIVKRGDTETRVLTLGNAGAAPTDFQIRERSQTVERLPSAAGRVYTVPEAKESKPGGKGVAPLAQGGPDPFGYTYMDSSEPGGPQYEWIEIAPPAGGSGLPLGMTGIDDGYYWPIDLPWAFSFYDIDHSQLAVASNGTVYFDNTYLGYGNGPIPGDYSYGVNTFIAHWWDDMYVSPGDVYYLIEDDQIIIEYYQNSGCCPSPDHATWEVILFENGSILMQYQDTTLGDWRDHGASATVGIQGDTMTGLQYSYDSTSLWDKLAICFAYPGNPPDCGPADVPWLTESPINGTIDADSTFPIEVSFTALPTMSAGIYTATVLIRTEDPDKRTVGVPVTMTVVHAPDCSFESSSPDELGETTVFTNTTNEGLSPTTYQWDFGDGNPASTDEHPEHKYAHVGFYDVVLTATNQWGKGVCSNAISIKGVEASFTSNSPVLFGRPVIFTNTTLSNPPVVQWFWTFGDSNGSEEESPIHTFAEAGTYTVTLFAANLPYKIEGSVYDIYQARVEVRLPFIIYLPIVVRNH